MVRLIKYALILVALGGLSACALDKMAINMVADALAKPSGTVFTGKNDPDLVADALPFAIKLYESLLAEAPENTGLILATGSAYIMYANAFLQTPASMLPIAELEKKEHLYRRSLNLYFRAVNLLKRGLEIRHNGFLKLYSEKNTNEIAKIMTKDDVGFLYWTCAAWMAAYSLNNLDINIAVEVPVMMSLMHRALELDETYGRGSIHDFFISYYASMPEGMGGSEEKARYHFKRTLEISEGLTASPYVSLATSLSIKNQNVAEFRDMMNQALSVSIETNSDVRLANIINQRKAKWYLEHIEDFFILED